MRIKVTMLTETCADRHESLAHVSLPACARDRTTREIRSTTPGLHQVLRAQNPFQPDEACPES